MINHVE